MYLRTRHVSTVSTWVLPVRGTPAPLLIFSFFYGFLGFYVYAINRVYMVPRYGGTTINTITILILWFSR